MKRMIRVLLAAAVLVTSLTCTAFAATTDYTEDKSTNPTAYVGTVDYDAETGIYTATYTGDDLIEGNQYVLLVATVDSDGNRQITQEGIQYIDQSDEVNFTFIPKTVTDAEVLLGGVFADNGESPKVLGKLKVPYMLGDVDENGKIDSTDALVTLQITVGLVTPTATQIKAADVDLNDTINSTDALTILQYIVGLTTF